jgi:DeoR family glycerol-3-phosphate regulon repressor
MARQRQDEILDLLQMRGQCSITELAERLSVSGETIRRDIRKLADEGTVEAVRGGVALPEVVRETAFHYCLLEEVEAKQAIAQRAATEVENGERLFLAGGSTMVYFAYALRAHLELTVITNSIDIARLLVTRNGNRVLVAGGEVDARDGCVEGPLAVEFVRGFYAAKAVVSVAKVHATGGLMHDEVNRAEITRAMLDCAEQRIVLADHTRFSGQGLVRIAGLDEIDALATDRAPAPEFAAAIEAAGVRLLQADENAGLRQNAEAS